MLHPKLTLNQDYNKSTREVLPQTASGLVHKRIGPTIFLAKYLAE